MLKTGNGGLVSLGKNLNPVIGQILDRAGDAQMFRFAHRVVAEADPLHLARDRVVVGFHIFIIFI